MGFIQKYFLPKQIDFNRALQKQANASINSVLDLSKFCLSGNQQSLKAILNDEHQSRSLKSQNLRNLMNVFITPYDKESIYRIITQLDWIALSVKHLVTEITIYKVDCSKNYKPILELLNNMIEALGVAFKNLSKKNLSKILAHIESIHDNYDETTKLCALAVLKHLQQDDTKHYLLHKEIINQLKEVSKRIHISANTLEDMAMKII